MKSEKLLVDAFFDWLESGDGIRKKAIAKAQRTWGVFKIIF
jgi:hypothetical protein